MGITKTHLLPQTLVKGESRLFCKICLFEAPADAGYCPKCGVKLSAPAILPENITNQTQTEEKASLKQAKKQLLIGMFLQFIVFPISISYKLNGSLIILITFVSIFAALTGLSTIWRAAGYSTAENLLRIIGVFIPFVNLVIFFSGYLTAKKLLNSKNHQM